MAPSGPSGSTAGWLGWCRISVAAWDRSLTAPWIMPFSVSVYTSSRPLGKQITRLPDGTVNKRPLGSIVEELGRYRATQSAQRLRGAAFRSDLVTGVGLRRYRISKRPRRHEVDACAGRGDGQIKGGVPVIARDAAHLSFPDGPGVVMLDHDPHLVRLRWAQTMPPGAVRGHAPALRRVDVLDAIRGLDDLRRDRRGRRAARLTDVLRGF